MVYERPNKQVEFPPEEGNDSDENSTHSRFVRTFASIVGSLILGGAILAILADPMVTLRTGIVPKIHPPDVDVKPAALLAMATPPQVIILGSSRVTKLNPACVKELIGLETFNFGLGNSIVEGWNAAFSFAHDHAPISRVIIGVDVEGFMPHGEIDPRLVASKYLGPYIHNAPRLTWSKVTEALFSAQRLHFAFTAVRFYFFPPRALPPNMRWGADGFLTYPIWEDEERRGVLPREELLGDSRRILTNIWRGDFTELAPERIALFRNMLSVARDRAIVVDAFTPFLQPELRNAGASAQIAARGVELDHLLQEFDREGLLRYHRFTSIEGFGGDPQAYFDGLHMMESNTSRLLLKILGHQHGCGQTLPTTLNVADSTGN
jgi:hypothetical protein